MQFHVAYKTKVENKIELSLSSKNQQKKLQQQKSKSKLNRQTKREECEQSRVFSSSSSCFSPTSVKERLSSFLFEFVFEKRVSFK